MQLGEDLADAEHEGAGEAVRGGHEGGPAPRRPAGQRRVTDREQVGRGVAAERVADADPAVAQQAPPVAEPPLDHRGVARPVGDHQPAGLLLEPAEAGICRLAPCRMPACDAGVVDGSPVCQARARVAARAQPVAQRGQVAGAYRPAQHRLGHAVQLHHDQAGLGARARSAQSEQRSAGVPRLTPAYAPHQALGLPDEGVVGAAVGHPVQDRGEDDGEDRRDHQRRQAADPVGRVELERHHDDRHLGDDAEQHRAPAAERDDADQQQRPQHRADRGDQHDQAERVDDVGAGHARHQPERERSAPRR